MAVNDPYSLVGTWVFNETMSRLPTGNYYSLTYTLDGVSGNGIVEGWVSTKGYYTTQFKYSKSKINEYTHTNSGWETETDHVLVVTGGTALTDEAFANWIKSNAVATPSTITYNDTETSVEALQTATMHCAGKKAITDIVVNSIHPLWVTYNGQRVGVSGKKISTLNCGGKKMLSNVAVEVVVRFAHLLYNGVRLPNIPADALIQYPYVFIRKHTTNGVYQLFLSATGFYFETGGVIVDKGSVINPQYTFPIGDTTETEWANANNNTYYRWTVDDARPCMWSNHDIPNGSATATDIYFAGTEPIPTD